MKDVKSLTLEELKIELTKRQLEMSNLAKAHFDPRQRELYLKLHKNACKIEAKIKEKEI